MDNNLLNAIIAKFPDYKTFLAADKSKVRIKGHPDVVLSNNILRSSSLPVLVWKYGDKEGRKRYEVQRSRKAGKHTLDGLIARYGEVEGRRRHEERAARLRANNTLQGLIKQYGKVKGTKLYQKRCAARSKGASLEGRVARLGEVEGRRKHEEALKRASYSKTLQAYIDKYGKVKGTKLYKEKNSKLSVGVDALKKSGKSDEEIQAIREKHSQGSRIDIPHFLDQGYSIEEATKKYQQCVAGWKKGLPNTIEYWTARGFSVAQAKKKVSVSQTKNLSYYLNLYQDVMSVRDIEEWYRDINQRKTRNWGTVAPTSKLERKVVGFVHKTYGSKFTVKSFKTGRHYETLDLGRTKRTVFYPDIYIECGKHRLLIEVNGDLWHGNPTYYRTGVHPITGIPFKDIRARDKVRNASLTALGYKILVLWEHEINSDPAGTKTKITKFVNRYSRNLK